MSKKPDFKLNNKSLSIISAVIISWFPVFFIPFLNDDYQIISFYSNKSFFELLKVFWERGVYYYYWRPIPDFIHGLTLFIAGFHPSAFRLGGIIIYCIASLLVYRIFRFLGLKEKTAFCAALLFGILPSHAFEAAWIADQLESLTAIFLLLTLINYLKVYSECSSIKKKNKTRRKYLLFSAFWFTAALMTKEVAYTGIFIPVIALIYKGNFDRDSLRRTLKDVLGGFFILVAVFVYRIIFVGGTPFAASHFNNISITGIVKNFFIYIPLVFFPPEVLETIYSLSSIIVDLLLILAALIFLIIMIRRFKGLNKLNKNIFFTGCAWFIIFIIPALPTLMRWYVFTASIGLILMLSVLIETLYGKKIFFAAFLALLIFLGFCDFSIMLNWREAGVKMENALNSIKDLRQKITSDTLYIWGAPDKFKRVPMMKLGIQQSVEWVLGSQRREVRVLSPLRTELMDEESEIVLREDSDSALNFVLNNGRFLPEGGNSRSIVVKEEINSENPQFRIKIKTIPDPLGRARSEAVVKFLQETSAFNIFYTGNKFLPVKKERWQRYKH
ncbi:MAG TPA: glycosyltransferase family 39 protein [Ignavibacteriaceae bacterium]|nr:glycosyltransferase family 39 protein [Ignavibacteriaceae bacterium]